MRIIKQKLGCPVCKKIFENDVLASYNNDSENEVKLFNWLNKIIDVCPKCGKKLIKKDFLKYYDETGRFNVKMQTIPLSDKSIVEAYNIIAVEIFELIQLLNCRDVELTDDIITLVCKHSVSLNSYQNNKEAYFEEIRKLNKTNDNLNMQFHIFISLVKIDNKYFQDGHNGDTNLDGNINSSIWPREYQTNWSNFNSEKEIRDKNKIVLFDLVITDLDFTKKEDINDKKQIDLFVKKSKKYLSFFENKLSSNLNIFVHKKDDVFI